MVGRRWLLCILAASFFACVPESQFPVNDGHCFPLIPMKLVVLEHGSEWEPIVELLPDGRVVDYRKYKKIVGLLRDGVFFDEKNTPIRCLAKGENVARLTSAGGALSFDDADRLRMDKSTIIHVDNDGMVRMQEARMRHSLSVKITPFDARGKRTAVLLFLVMLLKTSWTFR